MLVSADGIACLLNVRKQNPNRLIGNDVRGIENGNFTAYKASKDHDGKYGTFVEAPWLLDAKYFSVSYDNFVMILSCYVSEMLIQSIVDHSPMDRHRMHHCANTWTLKVHTAMTA